MKTLKAFLSLYTFGIIFAFFFVSIMLCFGYEGEVKNYGVGEYFDFVLMLFPCIVYTIWDFISKIKDSEKQEKENEPWKI